MTVPKRKKTPGIMGKRASYFHDHAVEHAVMFLSLAGLNRAAQRCMNTAHQRYSLSRDFLAAFLQRSLSLMQRSRSLKSALLQRNKNSARATLKQRLLQRLEDGNAALR